MRKLSIYIGIIVCLIIFVGITSTIKEMIFPGRAKEYSSRVHLNTGNTIRVVGRTNEDIAIEISNILYPSLDSKTRPNGIILIQTEDWRDILSIIRLGKVFNSPVIPVGESITQEQISYINQASPNGIDKMGGTQIIIFGKDQVLGKSIKDLNYKTEYIGYSKLEDLQKNAYRITKKLISEEYGFIISEDSPLMSIPVGSWAANQGGHLLFANGDKLSGFSTELLMDANIKKVYILGNDLKIPEDIFDKQNIKVERIIGKSPEGLGINFAQFYDLENSVGWGANLGRKNSSHNYILCSKDNPIAAVIASQLSIRGKVGPLLWTDGKSLSKETENYLWKMKPAYFATPLEGPYINLWVIGDDKLISYNTQARADYAAQIQPYETMGEQGTSGLEAIAILLALSSVCGAIYITIHLFLRMKHLTKLQKLMWILTALILGPIGVWLYVISYKDRPFMIMNGITMWKRPLWDQVAVSTIMSLSFGASTMLALGYLMATQGMNLIPFYKRFGLFLFGNPMIIQILAMYIVGLIFNGIFFMPSILMDMKMLPYDKAVKKSFPIVLISITLISIGMMLSKWYLNMVYSPVIPEENNILWWGFMQLSVLIGGLLAYILNWQLVRLGKKMGTA